MAGLQVKQSTVDQSAHPGHFLAHEAGFDIVDCRACGFAHALPLPDPAALSDMYRRAYYAETKPDYLTRAAADAEWAQLAYDDRLDEIASFLPVEQRTILDIGSGPGFFLSRAVARGWQGIGVEPSRQAASFARERGLDIRDGFFTDEMVASLSSVSGIHMMNVLEHVPDAIDTLARTSQLLLPGGVLCIGVPNDFNPLQNLLRERRNFKSWWVAPPHHINYFDFDSLERVLTRAGFTPVSRLTSFPMELFAVLGANYVGDDALGRQCHLERKAFDVDLEAASQGARRRLYRKLAEAGLGREAIVIALKT